MPSNLIFELLILSGVFRVALALTLFFRRQQSQSFAFLNKESELHIYTNVTPFTNFIQRVDFHVQSEQAGQVETPFFFDS